MPCLQARPHKRRDTSVAVPDTVTDLLRRLDVAAEIHERLDGLRHERGGLAGVRERVGAWTHGARRGNSRGEDLGFDYAVVALVDRAHDHDRAAVLARVPHEELAARGRSARRGPVHCALRAFATACATVSRSFHPLRRTKSVFGLLNTRTAGSSRTRSAAATPPVSSDVRGAATFSLVTSSATNGTPAALAPAWASALASSSTDEPGA